MTARTYAVVASGLWLSVFVLHATSCASDSLHEHDVIAQLRSSDASDRIRAADRLGRDLALDPNIGGAVDALIVALGDSDALVRHAARAALVGSGLRSRNAVSSLLETLRGSMHPRAREEAAIVLSTLRTSAGNDVICELIAALRDPEPDVRTAAAQALGRIGAAATVALRALSRSESDSVSEVRLELAEAVANINPRSQLTKEILTQLMRDPDSQVRVAATSALVRDSALGEREVQLLATALRDPNAEVRAAAALALGTLGARSEAFVGALTHATADSDASVRNAANRALLLIRDSSTTAGLPAPEKRRGREIRPRG